MSKLAVVTGASSGIGAAYVRLLAEQGYDLMLVARRVDRLDALCLEVQEKWGVSAESHPTDLSDPQQVKTLADTIRGLPALALLINNAGFGTWGPLAEADTDKELAMLHVHINATFLLTQAALPAMIAQKKGGIINVSSIAAFAYVGGLTNYCASKAFLVNFSESLAQEVHEQGIQVQALCPGYTYTEFHDTAEWSHFSRESVPQKLWFSAETVAQISLDKLPSRKIILIPGRQNQLMIATLQSPSLRALRKIAKKILRR